MQADTKNTHSDILTSAQFDVFFGRTMLSIAPQILEDFFTYDENGWQFLFGVPPPWSSKMYTALAGYQKAIKAYFAIPKSHRQDASGLLKVLESGLERDDCSKGDIAAIMGLINWA